MKKNHINASLLILLLVIFSCENKLEVEDPLITEESITYPIEGIWLTDPSQSDDVNAFKYLVFEDSILHFYGENEIGNREYYQHKFSKLSNGSVTGMEVFVDGLGDEEDWSFHLFYELADSGKIILVEGLAMTFVGTKVTELPERENWVTNIELPNPEFTIQSSISDLIMIDISKSSNPEELLVLGTADNNNYMLKVNRSTGEILDEKNIENNTNYTSISYGGDCSLLLAKREKTVDILSCTTTEYVSSINQPDLESIWALCSDESNIWISCRTISSGYQNGIIKIDFDGYKISDSTPIVKSPHSMTYSDGYIWMQSGGFIHKVNATEMTTEVSYALSSSLNYWLAGIEYIEGNLYIIDGANTLYKISLN